MKRENHKFLLNKMCPNGIWHMSHRMEQLLEHQIRSLPKGNVSEDETRYPTTPIGMRAFLDKFFTRHYFQIQDSLIEFLSSEDFINIINYGELKILDIGSGPAVASLAITDIIVNLLEYLKSNGNYININNLETTYVLNDTSNICLGVGQQMLKNYFSINSSELSKVKQRIFNLEKPFPGNISQLKRIANYAGLYDIICLAYVIVPLNEEGVTSQARYYKVL